MEKKNIVIIVLVIVGLILGIFAITKLSIFKGGLIGQKVKLVYWGLWEPSEIMKPLIEDYQKKNPRVAIEYVKQSPIQYRERLVNSINSGNGPDIFRFHNTWPIMIYGVLAKVPTSVFTSQDFVQTFYPAASASLTRSNEFYGVPIMMDTLALFCNEELFLASGLTPPTTWPDLRKAASKLTVRDDFGRIKTAGIAIGTTGNVDHWSDILGLMMVQRGVDFRKLDSTISVDGKNLGEEVLTYYSQFSKVDGVWDETMPNSTTAFATGKLAMYFGPSWEVFEINQQMKNAQKEFSYKIIPVPQLSDTEINWASFWAEGVSNKSKYQAEAWDFLKYLSNKETLRKSYDLASKERSFGELYPRRDMKGEIAKDPKASVFLDQAETAKSWYLSSRTFDNGVNDKIIKYFEDAINSINKDENEPLAALKTASLGVGQVLSTYGSQYKGQEKN